MKCPKCLADTTVKSTRKYHVIFLVRSRLCFNGHRFKSYEVPAKGIDTRIFKTSLLSAEKGRAMLNRRRFITRNDAMTATQLSAKLGITEARVRQIRAEIRESQR